MSLFLKVTPRSRSSEASSLTFFQLFILIASIFTISSGSRLSVQSRHKRSPSLKVINYEPVDSIDAILSSEESRREKRDVNSGNKTEEIIAKSNVTRLEDTHNQLVVYWAGLDVIVCLARDSKPSLPSTLYISQDYGNTFSNVSSLLIIPDGNGTTLPVLDKFFNHPKNNGHFILTDIKRKYMFMSADYGITFKKVKVDFVPEEILFDPNSDHTIISYEKTTEERQLWVSVNYGDSWTLVQKFVKSAEWDESVVPTVLYIGRQEPNKLVSILSSTSLFLDQKDTQLLLGNVEEFEIKEEYIFATRPVNGNFVLLVSYKRGKFQEAIFPHNYENKHYHIVDVSDGQMFVCITHNESVTNLYIGNEPADMNEPPKFSLSLERIVFFKPNLTWSDSWLNDVTDEPFVELHHVEGLRGVYIASQFKSGSTPVSLHRFSLEQIMSVITFDQGGEWKALHTPDVDDDGEPLYCKLASNFTRNNCSLHISQKLNELYPLTRAVPILSQKSAVGLVIATGTVDTSLKGHLGVFLSNDGAVHWKQILKGNYLYNFGDHGGIIVAVKYYKIGELTNSLLYSTNEGSSWSSYEFYDSPIRVLGLMTEPGENTTVFFIFGSDNSKEKHSWVLIKVDLRNAFADGKCSKDDYKSWSPWDSNPGRHCLLGRTDTYERRLPTSNCYNGVPYERIIRTKPCLCSRVDFECDFGYVEDGKDLSKKCIRDGGDEVKAEWCSPSQLYFNKTKGYRKIPGDSCISGDSSKYLPTTLSCPIASESEFMLLAKRDSVLRINLNDFNHTEVLPLGKVRSVIAVDFSLKNNCIFWSDVNKDHIMRLHLDGKSEAELLVSEDLKSVEGLAYDWLGSNLYFSDGVTKRIEVIRTDVNILGRMRKRILDSRNLDKPRGLALHPSKGYLFWSDWSNEVPCIGRAELDGSNPTKIVQNKKDANQIIRWPNGITVDVDKNIIYWVDAFTDKMLTADLDGNNFRVFLENDPHITHPFALGVYKNMVYWDDWTSKSVFAKSTTGNETIVTIQSNLPRLMDLKVYGLLSQSGSNPCSNSKNDCEHLCLAKADNSSICACPDGLALSASGQCLCPDGKPLVNGTCQSNCNSSNTFKCKSSFCIPANWKCDGQSDCGPGDDSDEADCEGESTCAWNQFKCASDGKCIPSHWKCDFDPDCLDGSDEIGCPNATKCDTANHFECEVSKVCIMKKWVCDGQDDCGDSSDERNCTTGIQNNCKPDEFQCDDKRCILSPWRCDGDVDCIDGSDEANCTGNPCPEWKFRCNNTAGCILRSWVCDGDIDCTDESDESNCTSSTTPFEPVAPIMFGNCSKMEQMFQCKGLDFCIPIFWVNDGVRDCPLGDDELDEKTEGSTHRPDTVTISPQLKRCESDHFQCSSGECILERNLCDGVADCRDGSDESHCSSIIERHCPKGYIKCGLSNICVSLDKMNNGKVDCPNGYDENMNNTGLDLRCNRGEFICDDVCKPLYMICNGNRDCLDSSDERTEICRTHHRIYQIADLSVEIDDKFDRETALVEWWVDPSLLSPPQSNILEFLPSYCLVEFNECHNATNWIVGAKYVIGSDPSLPSLSPYTKYNVTVYTRRNGAEYPPAVHKEFVTPEGKPSPPLNLTVTQTDVSTLCVNWEKPLKSNGVIKKYRVFFSPPSPPTNTFTLGSEEKYCFMNKKANPQFVPGTNYTFWVTASNDFESSDESKVVNHVFNKDVAIIESVTIKESSKSSVTLQWNTVGTGFSEFEISYEALDDEPYKFINKTKSTTTSVTIGDLSPGTKFRFSLSAINKGMYGLVYKSYFETKGKPLPKVEGLKVSLSDKNIVAVSWTPVKDERSTSWTYGVFYGKSIPEISEQQNYVKSGGSGVSISELEACEDYFIDISLLGPFGKGPMSGPKQIRTKMSEKAPPKNLQIAPGKDHASVQFSWNSPCPILDKPIGYDLIIREVNLNHIYGTKDIAYSTNGTTQHTIKAPYGGRYEVTVMTNVSGSRPSSPAYFEGLPIPPPQQVQQCSACETPTIYWEPPPLIPTSVLNKGNVSYAVYLSEDEAFKKALRYKTDSLSLKFSDIEAERVYYVAVSLEDSDGLESRLSAPISFQFIKGADSQISIKTSNALGIVITVIIVIGVLVAALGVFIVRHKRLQVSFLNFASSHYNSSSGAAVFQQSMEEQDSPVIRGFSDDEPLLVA